MKSILQKINESVRQDLHNDSTINEESNMTLEEILPILQRNLPKLEELIKKHLKFQPKLTAELVNRGKQISIMSDDLSSEAGKLGKTIFKDIHIETWGGGLSSEKGKLWINPKLDYTHPSGGMNGTDFIWKSLWFDYENEKWIEDRLIF